MTTKPEPVGPPEPGEVEAALAAYRDAEDARQAAYDAAMEARRRVVEVLERAGWASLVRP